MVSNTVSFYSVRNRGITPEIHLIKRYLYNHIDDIDFRFFIRSEVNANEKITQMARRSREIFTRDTQHAICIDESFPRNFPEGDYVRLYIAEPFDHLFNNYLSKDKSLHKRNALDACTHVMAGSPLLSRLVKKNYHFDGQQIIDDAYLPLTWNIIHNPRKEDIRKKLEYYYPEMEGKKILTLLVISNPEIGGIEDRFDGDSMKKVLDSIDDDWFVLYNSLEMSLIFRNLPGEYMKKIGFTGSYLNDNDLLGVTDFLITNNGRYAVNYAGLRKPVYCLDINNMGFCDYMRIHHPGLYLKDPDEITLLDISSRDLNETEKSFYNEACIESNGSPFERILGLLRS